MSSSRADICCVCFVCVCVLGVRQIRTFYHRSFKSHIRDEVVTSLSLLLLQLDRYPSHRSLLDTPHQVGHEPVWCALFRIRRPNNVTVLPGDLVTEPLAGDYGNVLADTLVGVKVVREASVVLFNDDPRSLLHRLGPYSTLYKMRIIHTTREPSQTILVVHRTPSIGYKQHTHHLPSSPRRSTCVLEHLCACALPWKPGEYARRGRGRSPRGALPAIEPAAERRVRCCGDGMFKLLRTAYGGAPVSDLHTHRNGESETKR